MRLHSQNLKRASRKHREVFVECIKGKTKTNLRNIAMAMVKSEGNNTGKRRTCMAEGRSNKRRRRDTNPAEFSSNNAPLVQQEQADTSCTPTTVKRSSRFRGVSRHRWTGRFEAHLWDKLSWNVTQKKKGKQGTTATTTTT